MAEVVEAIAKFAERSDVKVYIERLADGYRWSPAHPGGPYPLLREVARLLNIDHHEVGLSCTAVDGFSVVAPADGESATLAAVVVAPVADRDAIAKMITRL